MTDLSAIRANLRRLNFNAATAQAFMRDLSIWSTLSLRDLAAILDRVAELTPREFIGFQNMPKELLQDYTCDELTDILWGLSAKARQRLVADGLAITPLPVGLAQIRLYAKPGCTRDVAVEAALHFPLFTSDGEPIVKAFHFAGWALARCEGVLMPKYNELLHRIEAGMTRENCIQLYRLTQDGIRPDFGGGNPAYAPQETRWSDRNPTGHRLREMVRAQGFLFARVEDEASPHGYRQSTAQVRNGQTYIYIHRLTGEEGTLPMHKRAVRHGVEVVLPRSPPAEAEFVHHDEQRNIVRYRLTLEPTTISSD